MKEYKSKCLQCENYQPYEPDAGLNEGCVADELYEDEDAQEIIEEVNEKVIEYMRADGYGCQYFKKTKER